MNFLLLIILLIEADKALNLSRARRKVLETNNVGRRQH